jgi:putative salt-induced outer membrane protein YdiY
MGNDIGAGIVTGLIHARAAGAMCRAHCLFAVVLCLFTASIAAAQPPAAPPASAQPEPPPPVWTGSAGLGFSMNRGNTDTTNFNLSFEAVRDPKTKSTWKFKGLYQRGDTNGTASVDRLLLDARDELALTKRVYVFGELQFLRDTFKAIDYLWAPAGGIGYKLVATPATTFNVDGGLGVKVEKNTVLVQEAPDLAVEQSTTMTDAVVTLSDKFEHKVSKTSSITQGFSALWKANDFGDVIYAFTAGVAASLTTRTQLKVEFLDSYASRPPSASVKQNDVALLTAFVYKF